MPTCNLLRIKLFAVAVLLLAAAGASAQVNPDQAADMLLGSARRAYNEKNFPFAAERFREFLSKFGNHKEAASARYGLGLSLLDGAQRDYDKAAAELAPLASNKDFAEHPSVLYHLGLAQRGAGVKLLAAAAAKPNEAAPLRAQAQQRFEEAAKQFAAAREAFDARVKSIDPDKPPPVELEWAARARCDQAEMLLRLNKAKEAQTAAAPFTKEASLAKSRYLPLGLYYHGFASFLAKDYLLSGRSLSKLAPFSDPVFGSHARYLLARVHHHDGERQEAATHYEGAIADYAKQKLDAVAALRDPNKFKNDPEEKARLEALVKEPPPDHVARSTFFLGVLRYEDGRFADAQTQLTAFVKQFPTSPLLAEAQLRLGFCHVQLKQFKEAVAVLQPLADKEPRLADQALLWIGKAHVGSADPANLAAFDNAMKAGFDALRKAADKAAQLADKDPEARTRRGEALVELGDSYLAVRSTKDAVAAYNQVLNEKLLPAREEELTERLASALHLAGDYAESDKVCQRFQQTYPKSPLLPSALFRYAENAWFSLLAVDKNVNLAPPDRARETARWLEESIKRYQVVVEKCPEFQYVNLARYGLGMAFYRKGELEKAQEHWEKIPQAERVNELAIVPYHLADTMIRLAPTKADDAVAAGKMEELLKGAIEQLDGFVAANAKAAQAPDAYLKLGHCHQRLAQLYVQAPADMNKEIAAARAVYELILKQYPRDPAASQAVFERAKCMALAKDIGGAVNELRKFTADPLRASPTAPMAVLHLATLLRSQNKAQEAADLLGQCRQAHEAALLKDPARAGWAALLQYHHGVALKEAGKRAEARAVFDLVLKSAPDRPEAAEAALRWGQSLKDDGQTKLAEAHKKLAQGNLKKEDADAARKLLDDGLKDVRDADEYLWKQAEALKDKQPASEARARMIYEAAWGNRILADLEIEAARAKLEQELWMKLKDEAAKRTPAGQTPPFVPKPNVPLTMVPVQPAEKQAQTLYRALIDAFPDLAVNADARFELAELLSERGDHDGAIKQLKEALDKEPPPELTDKVRVRLGSCYLAKGDTKAALAQLNPIANNAKSAMRYQALYRSGECFMQTGDYNEAVKRLARFRDEGPLQALPGVSDRAVLRLGHAYEKLKQWEPSRQAHEFVANRFPNGPWALEARYGMGWALQNLGRFDDAVNHYNGVVAGTATELGAKAQLNIGLCRLAQKKYPEATTALLVVPYTYDYPQLSAVALLEAARAFAENKQTDQAVKLLERVVRDHPDTEQAEAAKKRLEELKKG
jgi:TolA-binding protein